MSSRLSWRAAALAFAILAAPEARAEQPSLRSLIKSGKEYYDRTEFDDALTIFLSVVERKDATKEELVEIHRYMGSIYFFLGAPQNAEFSFRSMLAVDQSADLDPYTTPPELGAFFKAIKNEFSKSAVTMSHRNPLGAYANQMYTITVELNDPARRAAEVILFFRMKGAAGFTKIPARSVSYGTYKAEFLPQSGSPRDGVTVEYYIQALSSSGAVIAEEGSLNAPLEVYVPAPPPPPPPPPTPVDLGIPPEALAPAVPPSLAAPEKPYKPPEEEPARPFYMKWWFYAAVAAAAGAAVAVPVYFALGEETKPGRGTLILIITPGEAK